ncbi:putative tetratricopeptide-like helical domain superfamily [Helianthus annuus]|nr:putative tetratricopeptide-like helical domain superfamily [Helianthus annuus]
MSSAAYNRLRRIFNTTAAATTTTAAVNAAATNTTTRTIKEKSKKPNKNTTSRLKTQKLAFEPLPMSQLTDSLTNLKMFIDKFKKASNTGPFRYSYKYYEDVVNHLAHARQHYYIEQILEHQKRYKTDMTHEPFVARLISLYGKSRMYDHARKLFDEMPELNCLRTVLSANALLTACVNSKRFNEIPELFREIREDLGIEPDDVSYNVVIKAFCDMDDTDSALKVIDEMEKKECECNLYTYNTVLDALYRNGNILEADKQWEVMKSKNLEPDIRSYNAKVRGLVVDKQITEAVGLLDEMKSNGVNPDVYTYNGVINGFVKADDLVEVKKWYAEMVENKIVPDSVTFRIIIAFACKKGDYKYGFDMSKEGLLQEDNVGRLNLQRVLDGLVKESAIDEAKELVKLVDESKFIYYKLKLAADL